MGMTVASLRRYPVKSMGGEALDEAAFDLRGLAGDRWYAVEDEAGLFASGKNSRRCRRRDAVFGYAATTAPSGVVVVGRGRDQWLVGDPLLDAALTRALGATVRVAPEGAVPHQDGRAVSLVGTATLDWCARRWGVDADPRRLRANVVVATHEPFVEEAWCGREVSLGGVTLRVVQRTTRCRTIDVDQDGATTGGRWLKPLSRERDMSLGVYADVSAAGVVRVGDAVSLGVAALA